jgi:hypothetical protein
MESEMQPKPTLVPKSQDEAKLLEAIKAGGIPTVEDFKSLILRLDNHHILARVFLLDGTPFVFSKSPMKYIIFKEQVASEFTLGSQDVCIVGSARLGFSPSGHKFGRAFAETSDVDVVLISEPLFLEGSQALLQELNDVGPGIKYEASPKTVEVEGRDWDKVKKAIRNFVFNNFNPGLLRHGHPLRSRILDGIESTTGLFLALEPQIFVSKIRCRVFRSWKAAEDYYANSLRVAQSQMKGEPVDEIIEDEEEATPSTVNENT